MLLFEIVSFMMILAVDFIRDDVFDKSLFKVTVVDIEGIKTLECDLFDIVLMPSLIPDFCDLNLVYMLMETFDKIVNVNITI